MITLPVTIEIIKLHSVPCHGICYCCHQYGNYYFAFSYSDRSRGIES